MATKIVRVTGLLPKEVVVKTTTSTSARAKLAYSAAEKMVDRAFRDFGMKTETTEHVANIPTILELEIPVGQEEAVASVLSQMAKELRGL